MFGNNSFGSPSFGGSSFGSGFGSTTTMGAFGSQAQTTTQTAGPIGTTIRFVPLSGTDTVQKTGTTSGPSQITTRHQNISAMKEYESKSVDELRLEDYAAGRKVGQSLGGVGATPFGSMQPSTSQQNTSIFGTSNQGAPNLFGATPTQNQTTNIFGQPKTGLEMNNTSNLFNSSVNKPQTTVASSPFNIGTPFNANTSTSNTQTGFSLFGNQQTQPAATPFGASSFNTATSNTGGLSLFNKPAQQQTGFNSSPFGGIQPSTSQPNTSIFGASNQTTSISTSQQNTSIFGTGNQSAPNLFGATSTQNQTTNIFGQPKTGLEMNNTSNLFNSSVNKPQTTVASSPFNIGTPFNANTSTSNTQAGFSLFGNQQAQPAATPFGAPTFNTATSNTGGLSLFNKPAQQQTGFNSSPFGGIQQNASIFGASNQTTSIPTSQQNTSIFGTSNQGAPNLFGATSTQNQTTNIFGQPKTGLEMNNTSNLFNSSLNKPQTTVASSPFNIGTPFNANTSTSNTQTGFSLFGNQQAQPAATPFGAPTFNTATSNTGLSLFNKPAQQQTAPNSSPFGGIQPNASIFGGSNETTNIFGQPKTGLEMNNTSSLFNSSLNKPLTTVASSPFNIGTPFNANTSASNTQTGFSLFGNQQAQPTASPLGASTFNTATSNTGSSLFNKPVKDCKYKIEAKTNLKLDRQSNVSSVLFDGIEEDSTDSLKCAIDVFVPKKSIKKLELKPQLSSESPPRDPSPVRDSSPVREPHLPQDPSPARDPRPVRAPTPARNLCSTQPTIPTPARAPTPARVLSPIQTPSPIQQAPSPIRAPPSPTRDPSPTRAPSQSPARATSPDRASRQVSTLDRVEEFKISPKTNLILDKSVGSYDQLFDSDEDEGPLPIGGHKKLALHYISPNFTSASTATVTETVQKMRPIQLQPDLYAAENKLTRDIMSVCIAGSPRVRFLNGSRKFCYINGDSVIISELDLVPTAENGKLSPELEERFEAFLDNNSLVTSQNMNTYIETYDFITDASSHDLLHALYGNLSSKTPYAKQNERLTRVIKWLAATNQKLPPPPSTNLYQQVLYHMSCDRYDIASSLAYENNHPRLALLVATLNLSKDLMFEQLSSWRLSAADQYIDPELLKIYVLLSGLTEWKLSNGVTIHCLKGLKWTQQLCLLALHVTSFVTAPEKYGFHMLPLYIKRLDTDTNDVDYHILARHNPANALSAAESLIEEWFLLESLKSFHVINSETECINSDMIHCNLVSQLGPIDLRWACFVALHIINNEVRNQVLIRCLEQNQNQFREWKSIAGTTLESWLTEKLKIPKELIENAKNLAEKSR